MSVRYLVPLLAVLCCSSVSCSGGGGVTLQGSGATFPAPLYKRWFLEYYKQHPDVRVSYQAIGSGAGVRQFSERLVNFAASDAAMSDKEIAQVDGGVLMLPLTAGTIVLAYNIDGVPTEGLKLSRDAYAGIFLGNIKFWDDPAIIETNKGASLPHKKITVIHRAEGSGTTFVFTNHLSAINAEWKKGPGVGKTVEWPVGLGARGNPGVAALVQQTPGAIGYLEFGYAELAKLPMAKLENHAKEFVAPTKESSVAALTGVTMPENFRAFITDPKGKDAYPIATYTWVLLYKKDDRYKKPKVLESIKAVLRYCLTDGQQLSESLGYVPLPKQVAEKALAALEKLGS